MKWHMRIKAHMNLQVMSFILYSLLKNSNFIKKIFAEGILQGVSDRDYLPYDDIC